MKHKLTAIIVLLALCFVLCACNSSTNGTETNGTGNTTADSTKDNTEPEPSQEQNTDAYLQSDKYYKQYFQISDELFAVVSRYAGEEAVKGFKEKFEGTEQYNTGAFCEYFSIDLETYILIQENARRNANMSYLSIDSILDMKGGEMYEKKLDAYSPYLYRAHFGQYQNSDAFIKSSYNAEQDSVCIMPDGECGHTSYYHTIDRRLISHVGKTEFDKFKSEHAGKESFNIVEFAKKYSITREVFDTVYKDVSPLPYNPVYLFGDDNARADYFKKKASGIALGYEDGAGFKYNEFYTNVSLDIIEAVIGKEKFEQLREIYSGTSLPIGLICEYYSVTEEQYKQACEKSSVYTSNSADIQKLRTQIANGKDIDAELMMEYSSYLWELHFGEYYNNKAFFSEKYDADTKQCLTIIPKNAKNVSLYYTIDYRLMQYVGAVNMIEFTEKFGGTEDFNIVKFVEYFNITREAFEDIIYEYAFNSETELLFTMPYPLDCVYGDKTAQALGFAVR